LILCRASLHRIAELTSVARSVRRATCQPSRDGTLNAAPRDVVIEVVRPVDEQVWTIRAHFGESGGN
jgi:hypothetical protein